MVCCASAKKATRQRQRRGGTGNCGNSAITPRVRPLQSPARWLDNLSRQEAALKIIKDLETPRRLTHQQTSNEDDRGMKEDFRWVSNPKTVGKDTSDGVSSPGGGWLSKGLRGPEAVPSGASK